MASSNVGVRFVKCPKCYEVLAEFADVPVYKCGGCGAVLRAKVRTSTAEKTVRESLENTSQKLADSSSLANESISLSNQMNVGDLGVEKVAESDLHASNSNTVLDTTRKEVSEPEENRTEGRPSESSESDVQSSVRRDDTNAKERTQSSQEVFVDEEVEKSLNSALHYQHSSSLNEISEEPPCDTGNGAVFVEEDTKFTSLADDGSVSSRDGQHEDHVPRKSLPKSKRTFRRQKSSSMDDSIGKEMPPQSQTRRSFARDTTFGSEDFHSVQNWMGSEIDDDLISIPTDLLFQGNAFKSSNANLSTKVKYLDSEHLKILRKVDELRDELSEFLTKTVDGKRASQLKPRISRFAPSEQLRSHNLPTRLHKIPIHKDEGEKHAKAKKQAIKQYYRPVYNGAPFVICYKCWKLLQLPADFLVTKKRLHKLRCGACSEVLVFSFRPRTHSAPHSPVEAQHPPSEIDHHDDYIREGDIVSQSESFSSEPEPVLNVSRSSSYSVKTGAKGSSLHGLMGYPSASELLFEQLQLDRGNESSQMTTPEFYRPPRSEDRRRYGQYGTGTSTMKSAEIQEEEEESHEQITTRRRGSAIHGLLKKGVQELSHGLESMKLKVQSKG